MVRWGGDALRRPVERLVQGTERVREPERYPSVSLSEGGRPTHPFWWGRDSRPLSGTNGGFWYAVTPEHTHLESEEESDDGDTDFGLRRVTSEETHPPVCQ